MIATASKIGCASGPKRGLQDVCHRNVGADGIREVVDVDGQSDDHEEADDDGEHQGADHSLRHVVGRQSSFPRRDRRRPRSPVRTHIANRPESSIAVVKPLPSATELVVRKPRSLNRVGDETDDQQDRGQDDRQADLDGEGDGIVDA